MIEMEDADGIGRKGDEQAVQPLPTKGLLLGSKNNQMPEAAASSHLRQLGCMAVWLTFRRSDSAVSTGHEMLPPPRSSQTSSSCIQLWTRGWSWFHQLISPVVMMIMQDANCIQVIL